MRKFYACLNRTGCTQTVDLAGERGVDITRGQSDSSSVSLAPFRSLEASLSSRSRLEAGSRSTNVLPVAESSDLFGLRDFMKRPDVRAIPALRHLSCSVGMPQIGAPLLRALSPCGHQHEALRSTSGVAG